MKISASFLGSKNIPLTIKKLNETDVDYIHIDIMDGKYVKNKTMPFKEMKYIQKYTDKRLDVHLMVEKPSKYIDDYATLNTEFITIHLDGKENVITCLKQIKSYAIKAGIALNPDTNIQEMIPYLPYIDSILVMGVIPGKGGQAFLKDTIEKLDELQILLKEYPNLSITINIDGGMTEETASLVREKVDIITSGSYILKNDSYQAAINTLRK